MPHLHPMRDGLAIRIVAAAFVFGGCLSVTSATAGVSVDAIIVDGEELPLAGRHADSDQNRVRIPCTARRVTVRFSGSAEGGSSPSDVTAVAKPEGTRLRYRLEGYEAGWRDPPSSGRVDLIFKDKERGEVAIVDSILKGESAGWRGAPEESEFIRQSLEATAPEGTVGVSINALSIHSGETVGVIAIDDVIVSVEDARTGAIERYPLPADLGDQPFDPLAQPQKWVVSGNRRSASQLRLRSVPHPHPILVLVDDDPDRYAGWITRTSVRVEPGDRVRLSWSAAWSVGGAREAAVEYLDLKPGAYFFHVGAFFPNGAPAGTETTLPIEVYVPWHRRRSVWGIALAASLVVATMVVRFTNELRVRRRLETMNREHALDRERSRIARDLHDDVGAGLAEIAMQSQWIRTEIERGNSPDAASLADTIRGSADDLVRSIDAIVWAVNPANDTLERFALYVVQSTERFLDAAGLSMRFEIPDPLPAVQLDGAVRHRLFLAVREAVHNSVQHAQATSVTLSMHCMDGRLEVSIDDDGSGFDAHTVPKNGDHDGLDNMRTSMEELGGACVITPLPGHGTRVCLKVPLQMERAGRSSHG